MAYSPHTWHPGEIISSARLNALEQGVAAGGGGVACVNLDAVGYSSSSKMFCLIVYAVYEDDRWVVINDNYGDRPNYEIYGWMTPSYKALPVPIPSSEDMGVFLMQDVEGLLHLDGDIETSTTTVYLSYGSTLPGDCYRITGDCSIQFESNG